jgi:hypothetical protein
MHYLQSIEKAAFPVHVDDQSAVRHIQALRAAGFLDASVSPADPQGGVRFAAVHGITAVGRIALTRDRRKRSPAPSGQAS